MDSISSFLIAHKNVFLYFAIAIGLPSFLLYCAQCWTIIRHKSFHNSFYILFLIRALTDFLYTLDSYLGYRIPNLFANWFLRLTIPQWAFSLFIFLSSYSLLADNLATGFILLNRFTAITWPLRHENIWRKLMPLAILIIFGVPLYAVGIFQVEMKIVVEKDDEGNAQSVNVVEANDSTNLNIYMELSTIGSILFLVYCTSISVLTLIAYRRKPRVQPVASQQQNANNKGVERKLWFFAFFTFLGHMLIAVLLIAIYLATITQSIFFMTLLSSQYSWVLDLGTVVLPSWLLPWASPSFRRQLLADFLPKGMHTKIIGQPQVTTVKASVRTINAVAAARQSAPNNYNT